MGNCRGCVHVLGERKDFHRGEDVQMFRCGYAEKEFGGERWVAEPLTGDCEAFKSIIPEEGWIKFPDKCLHCINGKVFSYLTGDEINCGYCKGTGLENKSK
ncbi:hypothetical protein [Bacillus toyonensis]|uniref:hypothetical protein n=1 Tax=Bacillus toyonensis TaxID=155322 RepID=UPI000BF1E8B4|nr:hypothetical protein [Bacillus toyonensis]PEL23430.1 hypothetical protein CN624_21255 [Bacillus toyonensis]PFY49088.1 hypothetical protein COL55_13350 [Bacillus toyonensis]PFY86011.1 hypothetical protein COL62_02115 [Bacillus toyonensis]PHD51837.1 hypothetical protein COF75_07340 [Bacillus toyonensis]